MNISMLDTDSVLEFVTNLNLGNWVTITVNSKVITAAGQLMMVNTKKNPHTKGQSSTKPVMRLFTLFTSILSAVDCSCVIGLVFVFPRTCSTSGV